MLPMATIPMPTLTESDMASTLTTMEDEQLRFVLNQQNGITNTPFRLTLITDTMAMDMATGMVTGMGMVMATMVENLQLKIVS